MKVKLQNLSSSHAKTPMMQYTSIGTKLQLMYKTLLEPLWTYGLQLRGDAKKKKKQI